MQNCNADALRRRKDSAFVVGIIMVAPDSEIARLENQVAALEQDRDYWRAQHDLVMQDWRADLEAWTASRAAMTVAHDACRAALADLLRFFDPTTGAVATRQGRDFLGDAFARAQQVSAADPDPTP